MFPDTFGGITEVCGHLALRATGAPFLPRREESTQRTEGLYKTGWQSDSTSSSLSMSSEITLPLPQVTLFHDLQGALPDSKGHYL